MQVFGGVNGICACLCAAGGIGTWVRRCQCPRCWGHGRTALPREHSQPVAGRDKCHCVSPGIYVSERLGFCPPHAHRALCQRLSGLPSHSPAFSSFTLLGLVQGIRTRLAQLILACLSTTTCRDVAGAAPGTSKAGVPPSAPSCSASSVQPPARCTLLLLVGG